MRKPLKCWTDYPFLPNDVDGKSAPIREVLFVEYDGNKLAKIKYNNQYYVFKSGYLYCMPVRHDDAISKKLHISNGNYMFKFDIDDWYDPSKDLNEFYKNVRHQYWTPYGNGGGVKCTSCGGCGKNSKHRKERALKNKTEDKQKYIKDLEKIKELEAALEQCRLETNLDYVIRDFLTEEIRRLRRWL